MMLTGWLLAQQRLWQPASMAQNKPHRRLGGSGTLNRWLFQVSALLPTDAIVGALGATPLHRGCLRCHSTPLHRGCLRCHSTPLHRGCLRCHSSGVGAAYRCHGEYPTPTDAMVSAYAPTDAMVGA
jgi:hypothetical protein